MQIVEVKEVDENLLYEIKNIIVSELNPVKIILFGSHAYGKPHKGSDLDLLVIVDNLECKRRDLVFKIRKLLRKYAIPKDIIVASVKEVEEWKNVKQSFLTSIINKGRVIYERKT